MAELKVTINGYDYPVYADTDFADQYLAGDVSRWPEWDALEADDQARALVSATRLLQRQTWKAGAPPLDGPPEVVQQATALLAVDIALKPTLGDNGSTGSNVKAVGAGSARVEFFAPVTGTALPSAAFDLLRGLLGSAPGTMDDPALDATAYGSHNCQRSRFDSSDYGRLGDGYGVIDPDELRY